MPKMHLLDINVWLALTFDTHEHHEPAMDWFSSLADDACWFCRLTQQGFLRLATNPLIFRSDALTLAEAWHAYDMLIADPRIDYAAEPDGIETAWRAYTRSNTFSPKVWNDAYLAAFAENSSLNLVTFDRGFKQYSGVSVEILS